MWEGLGYYSRARNLLSAARHIAHERNGVFPDKYEDIRALKGVGDYTAAAIASFAFNLPYPWWTAMFTGFCRGTLPWMPQQTCLHQKKCSPAWQGHCSIRNSPGAFNQAIMDFGALCCTPAQPDCGNCPLKQRCLALVKGFARRLSGTVEENRQKERFIQYLVVRRGDKTLVRKRAGRDIWHGLYEFPSIETDSAGELTETDIRVIFPGEVPEGLSLGEPSEFYRQTLTHREITAVFRELVVPEKIGEEYCRDGIFPGVLKQTWQV
jgi:A/G-specific adenine glycosylase